MNKNLDLVAKELYGKIESFPNLTLKDADENDVDSDQVEAARTFSFDYEYKGANLATVTITLEEGDQGQDHLKVLMSNNPMETQGELAKKIFFNFKKSLREFARRHVLSFDLHDVTKSNVSKTNIGESQMSESKLFGTSMTSYQNLGNAKLIVKHSAPVNSENPAGRAQRISSIYVENADGERFKYPYRHLNGARALAQHISHGGTPYDNIGQHVVGLSEELSKLRMFKQYVERNDTISEAMGSITTKVMERIDQVKNQIHKLQSPSNYQQFVESFDEQTAVEIPEDIMNDWIDRLTIRTFNEELRNVFPYIFKLVNETDIPVKEVGIEELVSEDGSEEEDEEDSKDESVIPEFAEYEQYLSRLTEAERKDIFGAENEELITQLNDLLSSPLAVGVDGTNVIQSLEGIIEDPDLDNAFKALAKIDSESDARSVLKDYISKKDEELETDITGQLVFGDDNAVPDATPEPAEPEPAAADVIPPAEAPPEAPPAEAPPEELPMPPAPVAEAMARESRGRMFNELKEFIQSMYNEDAGNFPKGIEGVKIACEKKFGDRVGPIAAKIVERMTSMGEMARMKKMSGMGESYPKHQDLSGISTEKLKSYLAKQSQQQGSGEGNQIKRVRSELQRREKTVTELSKNTLGKYVKAAAKDAEEAGRDQEYHGHKNDYARGEKRQKGIGKAVDRLTKEDSDLTAMLRIAGLR